MTSAYEVLHMLPLQVRRAEHTLTWAARVINLPAYRLPLTAYRLPLTQTSDAPTASRGKVKSWTAARWSDTVKYVLKWPCLPPYHEWAADVHTEGWKHMISTYRDNLSPYLRKDGTMALQSSHVT